MAKITKKILKKGVVVALSALGLALIYLLGIYICFDDWRNPTNLMYEDDLEYYNVISSSKGNEINLKSLFDFEWDKLFIQSDASESTDDLNSKLGFDANLPVWEVWFGFPCRVIFFSDKNVVFEFAYDKNYLDFAEKDCFLYPDTIVIKEGKKPIILRQE